MFLGVFTLLSALLLLTLSITVFFFVQFFVAISSNIYAVLSSYPSAMIKTG